MKKKWIIIVVVTVGIVGILAAFKYWLRTVPFDECSPLYRQYAGHEGIEASYVRDYPIDDTTLVDVTLLSATTDSAWESLCHDFILPEFPDMVIEKIIHGHSVTQWTASKDNPQIVATPTSTSDYDLVAIAPQVEIIYIFHPENESQTDAIITKLVTEL